MARENTETLAQAQPGLTQPLQERSRRSLEKFLEAAKEVVSERGFEDASVAEIVERSGLSVGAFYQRFENKAALLTMVHTRFVEWRLEQIEQFTPARWERFSIADVLGNVIAVGVRSADDDGGFLTACFRRALSDKEFAAREARTRKALALQLANIFEQRADEIGHNHPRLAADFLVRLIASMNSDRFHLRDSVGLLEFSAERMTSELLDVCLRYLGIEQSRDRGRVESGD